MIKKLEIILLGVFIVLCIAIGITIKNKNSMPSCEDTVGNFFEEMMQGNFRVAMTTYLSEVKENQIEKLESNIDLYKAHFQNVGIDINEIIVNTKEKTATCNIVVYKYNIEEIISDVQIRLLNVNALKSDGTYITENELNTLKKQYIKEAYASSEGKYSHVINTYELTLEYDEDYESMGLDEAYVDLTGYCSEKNILTKEKIC